MKEQVRQLTGDFQQLEEQIQQQKEQIQQEEEQLRQLTGELRQLTGLLVPVPAALALKAGTTTILLAIELRRNSSTSPSKYLQHLVSTKQISREALPVPNGAKDAMQIAGRLLKNAFERVSVRPLGKSKLKEKSKLAEDLYADLRQGLGNEVGPIAANALRAVCSTLSILSPFVIFVAHVDSCRWICSSESEPNGT